MLKTVLILICLCAFCKSQDPEFRYDYKYFSDANGWLKLHTVPMNWTSARMQCHLEGAVLLSPLNRSISTAITKLMESLLPCPTVIYSGVNNLFSEASYTSVEGVPLERMTLHWSLDEPAYFLEGCLVYYSNGTMANKNCEDHYPFICYKKDTKLDINECGTIDNEYHLKNGTENCFKYHSEELEWSKAFGVCQAEGAFLATTIDAIDWLVGDSPRKTRGEVAFIGYKCHDDLWWDIKGNFMTVKPHGINAQCACGGLLAGEFIITLCDPRPFICEKRVDSLKVRVDKRQSPPISSYHPYPFQPMNN